MVRHRRPVALWWFHFVDVTRVHLTMPWVVSFPISGPFTTLRAGQTGEKVGYLCIVLPDDDEQFTIKVTVNCF